jgi:hypothetical protein
MRTNLPLRSEVGPVLELLIHLWARKVPVLPRRHLRDSLGVRLLKALQERVRPGRQHLDRSHLLP